jgi:small subunit ribosomal protein S9
MATASDTTKKPAAKKVAAKPAASAAKPRVAKKKVEEAAPMAVEVTDVVMETAASPVAMPTFKPTLAEGRYSFATGRRKTAVATIRLVNGQGDRLVNKKPFTKYFDHSMYQNLAVQPLVLTGLNKDFSFTATINGGGLNAQAEALRHAIAQALGALDEDIRKVLKKNGFLTRDDRRKERKKPGLKGARRGSQWAKR